MRKKDVVRRLQQRPSNHDGCLMDSFVGADGINGRVEDFWTPVDRETFQIRFAG